MKQRYESSPREVEMMNTEELRENFLMESLFEDGKANYIYSHYDRMVSGGVIPLKEPIALGTFDDLRSDYFLQRREMGVINTGGPGSISVDGTSYDVEKLSCLYISKGKKDVSFTSSDSSIPAKFFVFSAPAHTVYHLH